MSEKERGSFPQGHELVLRLSILVALAALVLLCCVSCATPTRRSTSTPLLSATPTFRGLVLPPTFTQTQRATATAQAPTHRPTSIPTLSVTSAPAVPADVQLYLLRSLQPLKTINEALAESYDLMGHPRPDDIKWLLLLSGHIADIILADEELRSLDAPEEVAAIHEMVLDATGDIVQGTKILASGIDNRDSDELRKADQLMKRGDKKIQQASALLREYLRQFESEP